MHNLLHITLIAALSVCPLYCRGVFRAGDVAATSAETGGCCHACPVTSPSGGDEEHAPSNAPAGDSCQCICFGAIVTADADVDNNLQAQPAIDGLVAAPCDTFSMVKPQAAADGAGPRGECKLLSGREICTRFEAFLL